MDRHQFDELARAWADHSRRWFFRSLGASTLVGLTSRNALNPVEARRGDKNARHERGQDTNVSASGKQKKKKKPQRCVQAGGSCKKPKKGKARKCCAGLNCDAKTRRCTAPATSPPAAKVCPEGLVACEAGCLPQTTGCCPQGKRPCDGACVTGNAACQEEFAACMAPATADWYAAVNGCAISCENEASATCRECLAQVLQDFADPLSRCVLVTQTDGTATRAAQRGKVHAEATVKSCDLDQRRQCRLTALASSAGQGTAQTLVGAMEGPIGALGGFLLSLGQFQADIEACERKFGCPGGECDLLHSVCCPSTGCRSYDPATQSCSRGCAKDSYCNAITQTCAPRCKTCLDYLIDGRYLPCGQITNNCGKVLTCKNCANTERCESRRCVPKTCVRGRENTAAADDCCLPQTCEDLGKTCGTWDAGCSDWVDCGPCECEPHTCPADPVQCGDIADGCGSTMTCPCGGGKICGHQTDEISGPICCRPSACSNIEYNPGGACLYDHCGETCQACFGATPDLCAAGGPCPWGAWAAGNA